MRRLVMLAVALAAVLMPAAAAGAQAAALTDAEAARLAAEAAGAYESGDFVTAESAYRRLVEDGRDSAAVYYNLGNTLYRLGRTGQALLAYERALRRDPSDGEIRDNLDFVSGRIVDRVEEPEGKGDGDPLQALWSWHGRLPRGLAVAGFLLLWWGFNACLAVALLAESDRLRRAGAYLLPLALLSVLASGAILGMLVYRHDMVAEGVIQPSRADLLSAPGEGAVRLTTVHEGLKVRLRARRGDWLEVVLPNGLRGWLPASAVGVI